MSVGRMARLITAAAIGWPYLCHQEDRVSEPPGPHTPPTMASSSSLTNKYKFTALVCLIINDGEGSDGDLGRTAEYETPDGCGESVATSTPLTSEGFVHFGYHKRMRCSLSLEKNYDLPLLSVDQMLTKTQALLQLIFLKAISLSHMIF